MKKDVILRNLERLIYCNPQGEQEPIEPMSEWKWNKLYQLAIKYNIGPWVADGIRCYEGDFFLNASPALLQKLMELSAEKKPENLDRFQLDMDRKVSMLRRFSKHSLRVYANDIINTVKSIEE